MKRQMLEDLSKGMSENFEKFSPKRITLVTWTDSELKPNFKKSKTNLWQKIARTTFTFAIKAELSTKRSKKEYKSIFDFSKPKKDCESDLECGNDLSIQEECGNELSTVEEIDANGQQMMDFISMVLSEVKQAHKTHNKSDDPEEKTPDSGGAFAGFRGRRPDLVDLDGDGVRSVLGIYQIFMPIVRERYQSDSKENSTEHERPAGMSKLFVGDPGSGRSERLSNRSGGSIRKKPTEKSFAVGAMSL